MTEQTSDGNAPAKSNLPSADQITPLLTGLLYPSESDEPVEWVACPLKTEGPLTVSQLKDWLMLPPAVYVEERPAAEFWQPVTTVEDWYGDDEKKRTATFSELKTALQTLTEQQVFRVGDTEIGLYLLGKIDDGSRVGLKTNVVET